MQSLARHWFFSFFSPGWVAGPLALVHFLMERCQLHKSIISIGTNYHLSEPSSLKSSGLKGQQENELPLTPSGVVFGFWPCREQGLMGNRPFCLPALRPYVSWEISLGTPILCSWDDWIHGRAQSCQASGLSQFPNDSLSLHPQASLPTSRGFQLHTVLVKEVAVACPRPSRCVHGTHILLQAMV